MKQLDKIDIIVFNRIKHRRVALNINQKDMASKIGVSMQQYNKYERGENRITAGRLNEIAKILKVNISYFFQEEKDNKLEGENYNLSEISEFIKLFSGIESQEKRRALLNIMKSLSW